MKRKLLCILAAVCFLAGIFGSAVPSETAFSHTKKTAERTAGNVGARILAVDEKGDLDDFHFMSDAKKTVSAALTGVRGGFVWILLAAALLIPRMLSLFWGMCFGRRKISVFRVVVFIHRTDGKKKPRFDLKRENQNGRLLKWRSEQNIKCCQWMKKKKCSAF